MAAPWRRLRGHCAAQPTTLLTLNRRRLWDNLHIMSNDTGPAPISDVLRRAIAQAVESGRTNYLALERKTGVSRASIMRFVRGTQSLHLGMADRLAAYFGLKLQQKERVGGAMNYWWVNQGRNFIHERRDGYLFASAQGP